MFKKFRLKLKSNTTRNQTGSVLTVSLIVMVVLAASVATITQVTANQLQNTSIRIESIKDVSSGEMMIQQAVGELRTFLDPKSEPQGLVGSSAYDDLFDKFAADYDVFVTDVSGQEGFTNFVTNEYGTSIAYKFVYKLDTGKDLVKYAYTSSAGTVDSDIEVMDFSLATNGDIIANGGYYKNASLYATNIRFGQVSPYIERTNFGNTLTPALTPVSTLHRALTQEYFPEFRWGGVNAQVYYSDSFTYCGATCFNVGTSIDDNFVIDEDAYEPIIGSLLETGNIPPAKIQGDFFGDYNLTDTILSYVKNDGPTKSRKINADLTLETLGQEIIDHYSGEAVESCYKVWKNKWKYVWVCSEQPSSKQYTNITDNEDFDPRTQNETLDYSAIYDGDLVIKKDFTMSNIDTETLVVNGNLTFKNTRDINVTGMIVVLGDLIFEGESVEFSGGFYVTGESRFNFKEGYGIISGSRQNDWSFSLYSKKSVIVESVWETHYSNPYTPTIDWYVYTDESIYIDSVNSNLDVEGNFHARALGLEGPFITLENKSQVQIHGIVINAFNGYINKYGTPYFDYWTERFTLNADNDISNNGNGNGWGNISPGFIEEPNYDPLVVSNGAFNFETSEFTIE